MFNCENKVKNLNKFKSSYQTTNQEKDTQCLAFQRKIFIGSALIMSKYYLIFVIKIMSQRIHPYKG